MEKQAKFLGAEEKGEITPKGEGAIREGCMAEAALALGMGY